MAGDSWETPQLQPPARLAEPPCSLASDVCRAQTPPHHGARQPRTPLRPVTGHGRPLRQTSRWREAAGGGRRPRNPTVVPASPWRQFSRRDAETQRKPNPDGIGFLCSAPLRLRASSLLKVVCSVPLAAEAGDRGRSIGADAPGEGAAARSAGTGLVGSGGHSRGIAGTGAHGRGTASGCIGAGAPMEGEWHAPRRGAEQNVSPVLAGDRGRRRAGAIGLRLPIGAGALGEASVRMLFRLEVSATCSLALRLPP